MKDKLPKVIFILSSISQPRCIKRIQGFLANNIDLQIYGFDRGRQNINASIKEQEIHILVKQSQGKNYIKRLFQAHKAIRGVKKIHENKEVLYYSFGFLPTLLLKLSGIKYYVYEISDIFYGYKKFSYFRWAFKIVDKILIKKSTLTVMTSEGFSYYLFKDNPPKNIVFQPNKMDHSFTNKKILAPRNDFREKIIFSFIGSFRSPRTIFRFARIIGEKYSNYEFHFYGDSQLTGEVIDLAKKFNNIKYFGPFKNPEQLSNIYSKIDILIACYDNQELNERILEPNKFYEALYFRKPIIVSEKTFLAERVKHFGCGFTINALNDESIVTFINSIDIKNLNKIKTNIKKIDLKEIIDDNSIGIIKYLNKKL